MPLTKTIKIKIKKCNELDYKNLNKILKDIRYQTCKASNKAMRMLILNTYESMDYKDLYEIYPNFKKLTGKSLNSFIYDEMKNIMDISQTGNVAQTQQFVENRFKDDKKKGLLKNEVSCSNFKKDMPIILHNKNYKITKDVNSDDYLINCSLFNKTYQKENNIKKLSFVIDKMNGNQKETINKIISEEYKQGFVQIKQDKKGKWYFAISFSFLPEIKKINKDRILGIDLGVVNTAALQIWDINKEDWDRLSWKECMLDGQRIIQFRQKVEARKRSFLRSRKISNTTNQYSQGNKGHGVQAKIKPIDHLNNRIANFRNTINHQHSKYVIDIAIKYNCGVIQMEDLTKFTEITKEKFLKNWSYYDLQNKIEYKARERGIEIIKINPEYTSQRCCKCGYIDKKNRKNQKEFECIKCGFKENADINAAKNISLPNIEELIKKELKT